MEQRVSHLEKTLEKIDAKLEKLLERMGAVEVKLASVDGKIDAKASPVELANVKGRVDSLPTTWQMISLVVGIVGGIIGSAFLTLKFGLPHAP